MKVLVIFHDLNGRVINFRIILSPSKYTADVTLNNRATASVCWLRRIWFQNISALVRKDLLLECPVKLLFLKTRFPELSCTVLLYLWCYRNSDVASWDKSTFLFLFVQGYRWGFRGRNTVVYHVCFICLPKVIAFCCPEFGYLSLEYRTFRPEYFL